VKDKQMKVLGHDNVSMDNKAIPAARLFEDCESVATFR
jgi:hypothetical protein